MKTPDWRAFSDVDAPEWVTEADAAKFCSLLNAYIPRSLAERGARYQMLNRYPSGRLYFALVGPTS